MNQARPIHSAMIWMAVILILAIPIGAAATSPLLQWRSPVYIAAGFAGIVAMALVLFQPLLAAGLLPGVSLTRGQRLHRWIGLSLVLAIVVHVAGLWITSPPDVIDALLFRSPTPFSIWGVLAMWCVFVSAALVAMRKKLRLRPRTWKIVHKSFAVAIVADSVVHTLLIDGTMETVSKMLLCAAVIIATVFALAPRLWPSKLRPSKPGPTK